ncbi:MAG: hypothetical protein IJD81_08075, partial [Oscillospiraceae bacterium]|nr:hypothetical protein [Oscillospiraceae bacterium]
QVVRQWTANPRLPGSNPGGASRKRKPDALHRVFLFLEMKCACRRMKCADAHEDAMQMKSCFTA